MWIKHNGPIPEGYHIHHLDHDTDNNDISNLALLEAHEHLAYHASLQDKEWLASNMKNKAMPAAIKWHKSEEGREWHTKHYEKMKCKLHKKKEIECEICGRAVEVIDHGDKNKYCSNNCRAKARRMSGVDNITVVCPICNKKFTKNKYSKSKTCSLSCGNKIRYETNQ